MLQVAQQAHHMCLSGSCVLENFVPCLTTFLDGVKEATLSSDLVPRAYGKYPSLNMMVVGLLGSILTPHTSVATTRRQSCSGIKRAMRSNQIFLSTLILRAR